MTTDELDQLLLDRFNLRRSDLIAALKTLPAQRPWAATLTTDEARLLDDAGFTDDREGLGVNDSRVRQRRRARTLWAINDGGTWVYPSIQFEIVGRGRNKPLKLKHVRGLDEVLPHLLVRGLHPTAVAGFLMTPQSELRIDGQPKSVREWLLHGESVEPVPGLLEIGESAAT